MKIPASTIQDYLDAIPEERKESVQKLRGVILKNLPKGFVECLNYGMPSYVVPHSLYPSGYHCDAKLLKWFTDAYTKLEIGKLDMGKSCIRFKKPEHMPFKLMGELAGKTTPKEWIALYEKAFKG